MKKTMMRNIWKNSTKITKKVSYKSIFRNFRFKTTKKSICYSLTIYPLHRTIPFISRYEKARVLGEREKQLDAGAKPFIEDLDRTIVERHLIALKELEEKKSRLITTESKRLWSYSLLGKTKITNVITDIIKYCHLWVREIMFLFVGINGSLHRRDKSFCIFYTSKKWVGTANIARIAAKNSLL